jgi:hypothetical protein
MPAPLTRFLNRREPLAPDSTSGGSTEPASTAPEPAEAAEAAKAAPQSAVDVQDGA